MADAAAQDLEPQAHQLRAEQVVVVTEDPLDVQPIDLEVSSGAARPSGLGEWLTLTGTSGSGKTLLIETLSGLRAPRSGQVLLDGRPIGRSGAAPIGIVLQSYGLAPLLTAAETVALPLQIEHVPRPEIRRRTDAWLDQLGLLATADRPVSELSGGQRQRVAIARALAREPVALLLDEPTAELDEANRDLVLALLDQQRRAGVMIVVVGREESVLSRSDTVVELVPAARIG